MTLFDARYVTVGYWDTNVTIWIDKPPKLSTPWLIHVDFFFLLFVITTLACTAVLLDQKTKTLVGENCDGDGEVKTTRECASDR